MPSYRLEHQTREFSHNRLVYRIENSYGEGPFQSQIGKKLENLLIPHWMRQYGFVLPRPFDEWCWDGEPFVSEKHICAVKSVAELLTWFNEPALGLCKSQGFYVAVYEVSNEHLTTAEFQVWFEPTKATFVKYVDCSELALFNLKLNLENSKL